MNLGEFEEFLKQAIGLDVASIGRSAIERAVGQRMTACGAKTAHEYGELVKASESERQELIETVVVPETWFFRDREAFAALTRLVLKERATGDGVLRVLSLPSSTGEEAYSIAMALFDAGLTANRFSIDAVDVSRRALACAERAIYGKNSFRGSDLGFRQRYFQATEQGDRLSEQVSRQVRFQRGNLFAGDISSRLGVYDVVFCRNLLIYFDQGTQDRAIRILAQLLKTQGLLFVAPAETGLLLGHDFTSLKLPLAFAFRKGIAAAAKRRNDAPQSNNIYAAAARTGNPAASVKPGRVFPFTRSTPAGQSADAPAAGKLAIEQATQFADQGRFVEAVSCCEESLRENGPSAQAFYLMGLVRDATGNRGAAAESYRKALYLDPEHHEALLHLSFLTEQEGNPAAALALRERARRLEQKRKA